MYMRLDSTPCNILMTIMALHSCWIDHNVFTMVFLLNGRSENVKRSRWRAWPNSINKNHLEPFWWDEHVMKIKIQEYNHIMLGIGRGNLCHPKIWVWRCWCKAILFHCLDIICINCGTSSFLRIGFNPLLVEKMWKSLTVSRHDRIQTKILKNLMMMTGRQSSLQP